MLYVPGILVLILAGIIGGIIGYALSEAGVFGGDGLPDSDTEVRGDQESGL